MTLHVGVEMVTSFEQSSTLGIRYSEMVSKSTRGDVFERMEPSGTSYRTLGPCVGWNVQ